MKVKELGFTLVEMMAVIILLGVVSLVAIPQVNKIIKNTRMSVFKDSAYGVIRAGELYYRNKEINREPLIDTTFVFPNASGLEINGDVPKSGKMVVTSDGSIQLAISNGKYCARKGYNDSKVSVNEDITNCTLESIGAENPGGSGTGGTTGTTQLITSLELNTTSVSVINGGTYQIEATIIPTNATNKSLRYISNNTSVVTVSDAGLITGVSGGETTVTVTTTDGSNISKTIDIIVRQQISNVELDITSASIDVGESVIVNATITPSNAYIKTLKWESSNESVATVNNGIITGVNPGTTVITATTQDGTLIENKVTITVKEYSITYNVDGGTLPSDVITSYHASTETFSLPTPTKVGYTFNGWYESEEFTGNAVTQIITGTNENKVYYAKWSVISYSITYNLNSGTQASGAKTSYTIETATFSLPTPTRDGYTFNGWYEKSDFSGTALTQIAKGTTGNKTYYAKWTIINYNITYNLNSGTQASGAVTEYTVETATFSLPTPTRANYIFKGWYESSAFSGSAVTQITKGTTGNKTYYAKWEKNEYVVLDNSAGKSDGGWTKVEPAGTVTTVTPSNGTLSIGLTNHSFYVVSKTAVDVSKYSKMHWTFTSSLPDSGVAFNNYGSFIGLTSSSQPAYNYKETSTVAKYTLPQGSTSKTYTFDISSLTGKVYPIVFLRGYSYSSVVVTKLYFE